ncbi:galactose mutarotase [Amphritea atlantica]|uniref:Aldose 1-epimerase n=1 Tax=Amphritea atlantica TaxID=355243 RepID=A0ABY5GSJ9_9GAMM|nr:galactose mutarotase [Amphritea atlantica]
MTVPELTSDTPQCDFYTLQNDLIRAEFCSYGARLMALYLRNPDGSETNIAVGLSAIEHYQQQDSYIGAICGRYANRIANAEYRQGSDKISLSANEGANHLHGGDRGFDKYIWNTDAADCHSLQFSLTLPDGDQGYPGQLTTRVTYTLSAEDTLTCRISAISEKATVLNITHHAYWNLSGEMDSSAAGHTLQIDADAYLPVDEKLIPLPGRAIVDDTRFDFRSAAMISEQLTESEGFDHNFCLNGQRGELRTIARLSDPASGRCLSIASTEAGLQFYLAQHFSAEMISREGAPLHPSAGIALEPQTFPDAPNRPDFPSAQLQPGETYQHIIQWQFGYV